MKIVDMGRFPNEYDYCYGDICELSEWDFERVEKHGPDISEVPSAPLSYSNQCSHQNEPPTFFVRVSLERRDDGEVWASSTGNQSSGVLRSMSLADGLLVFSAEATRLAAGDIATVQVIDEDWLASEDRGF